MPRAALLLSEPPASLRADCSYLVTFVLAVIIPPCHVAFEVHRPTVGDTVLHFERRHQYRIVEQVGLNGQPLYCRSMRLHGRFLPHRCRLGGRFRHAIGLQGRFRLFHFRLFLGNDFYGRFGFPVAGHREAGAQFGKEILQHVGVRHTAPQVHELFLASVHYATCLVEHPYGRMVKDMQHLFLV